MNLPAYFKTNQRGQILIVFLLVLVVGLAVTLSIASRTITDIRQTTTSDDSNKAYFAAEAGVEAALKKIDGNSCPTPPTPCTFAIDFTASSNSNASTEIKDLKPDASTQLYQIPELQAQDNVSQVSLLADFTVTDPLTSANLQLGDGVNIYWGNSSPNQGAIEVSVVSKDSGGGWHIAKYGFDPNYGSHGNKFCGVAAGTTLNSEIGTTTYQYVATIDHFNAVPSSCSVAAGNSDTLTAGTPVLLRIRMLYNSTSVPVAICSITGGSCAASTRPLSKQGQLINSTGNVPNSSVVRKLVVYRSYPALPAIFDYVLFNGSTTNPLSK